MLSLPSRSGVKQPQMGSIFAPFTTIIQTTLSLCLPSLTSALSPDSGRWKSSVCLQGSFPTPPEPLSTCEISQKVSETAAKENRCSGRFTLLCEPVWVRARNIWVLTPLGYQHLGNLGYSLLCHVPSAM